MPLILSEPVSVFHLFNVGGEARLEKGHTHTHTLSTVVVEIPISRSCSFIPEHSTDQCFQVKLSVFYDRWGPFAEKGRLTAFLQSILCKYRAWATVLECFAPLAKFTSELLFESAASKVTDYSQ